MNKTTSRLPSFYVAMLVYRRVTVSRYWKFRENLEKKIIFMLHPPSSILHPPSHSLGFVPYLPAKVWLKQTIFQIWPWKSLWNPVKSIFAWRTCWPQTFRSFVHLISIKGASVCRILIVTCVPEKPSLKSEEFQMAECRINIKPLVEIKGDGVPN